MGYGIMNADIAFDQAWCTKDDYSVFIYLNGIWTQANGRLSLVSVGENGLKGISSGGTGVIYYRVGITNENPSGTKWFRDGSGTLHQITSGSAGKANTLPKVYHKYR